MEEENLSKRIGKKRGRCYNIKSESKNAKDGLGEKGLEQIQQLFLQAMNAAVKNEQVDWQEPLTGGQWQELFHMAQVHRVLPMVFQAVYACPAAASADRGLMGWHRLQTMQHVTLQTQKTAQFLPVLEALRTAGVHPLVVKGIVCRSLYPEPDYRLSSDEDILVCPEEFDTCRRVLEELGMTCEGSDPDSYEIPYVLPGTAQLIELHRSLFPLESEAYGDLNRFFERVHEHSFEAGGIPTLPPTEHLLYLILHAYKHFLHSGFGIRQVCDLIFFANAWGAELDWGYILECCTQVRAQQFAAALFRIGRRYLNFSLEDARYPLQWQAIYVDEQALLEDILSAGVYGDADMSRKHSSNITLQAVASRDKGGSGHGLLKSVFPSARDLENRYPYLKTKPILLPVAWTDRLLKYRRETASIAGNSPGGSIRIGSARVELLRQYGILDKK